MSVTPSGCALRDTLGDDALGHATDALHRRIHEHAGQSIAPGCEVWHAPVEHGNLVTEELAARRAQIAQVNNVADIREVRDQLDRTLAYGRENSATLDRVRALLLGHPKTIRADDLRTALDVT